MSDKHKGLKLRFEDTPTETAATEPESSDLNVNEEDHPELGWDDLKLTGESLAAVERMGFKKPTEVQQRAIDKVHEGRDLVVQAKTGSGKTLAFGLPILERLDPSRDGVQALVLTPTRELALQVAEEITRAGKLGNKTVAAIFGGASMNRQIDDLRAGAKVVVGTPGRILDHLNRRTLSLDGAWMVVLDEADEMLDKGFLPDVMKILDYTPKDKQTMLFSATVPNAILRLANSYCNEPEHIIIGQAGLSVNLDIEHSFYKVDTFYKFVALVNILHATPHSRVLIFCNQKSDVENVAKHLHEEGFAVGFLSGDLSQAVRQRVLNMFKDGIIDILVATDVAARGIDVYGVSHVINFDVPENKERYVHRTGRTGRAGRKGQAISLTGGGGLLLIGSLARDMGVKFTEKSVPTKAEVDARAKEIFIERLNAMEQDGYPDDLAIFADELVEKVDPYIVAAGLLTKLRQHGWDFDYGYDPENPQHKERLVSRPPLLGIHEDERARRFGDAPPSGGRGRGARPERGRTSDSDRRKLPPKKPGDARKKDSRTSERNATREWLSADIGTAQEGIDSPGDLLSLVCQTAGVRKKLVGKIELGEQTSRFQVDASAIDTVIEGFEKRKKEPQVLIKREG